MNRELVEQVVDTIFDLLSELTKKRPMLSLMVDTLRMLVMSNLDKIVNELEKRNIRMEQKA